MQYRYIYRGMRAVCVFIVALCCCLKVSADSLLLNQFEVHHLTHENGLANNTLFDIYQDKKGFLWLGTDVGITRYDGVHFHNYDLPATGTRAVRRICEVEQDSLLWIKKNGLKEITCFDKRTGLYIPLESTESNLLMDITDICVADSALYAITSKGIVRLDYQWKDDKIQIAPVTIMESNCELLRLQCGKKSLYTLDETNQIIIFNLETQKTQVLDYKRLKTNKDIAKFKVLNGILWISTKWNGTYCYRPETDELRVLGETNDRLKNLDVEDIDLRDDSTLIAATSHSILHLTFGSTDYIHAPIQLAELSFDNFMYDSFVKNRVTKLLIDKKNSIIWLGTFGKGLLKSNLNDNDIHRVLLGKEIKDINGVAQDAQGHIWLATKHNGLWKSKKNTLSPDMEFEMWEHSTPGSSFCLSKDNNGSLWIGQEGGIVSWINPLTNKTAKFQPEYEGIGSIGDIQNIYHCMHNRLWLVTEKGLFVYDYQSNTCLTAMSFTGDVRKVTSMYEDGDGIMWLGTNNGIRRAEVKNGSLVLEYGREDKVSIDRTEVLAVYVNRHNQLYVSYADKIVQTDGQREGVADIKILQKDMINGHTACIIDDKSGNTWMGNNSGIMTVNNKTKVSYTFSFPERFFNVCHLNDGQLLWVSSTGLMYFDPRTIKNKEQAKQWYISDLGINYNIVDIGKKVNGQVVLKKPIHQMGELVLKHSNNNVMFYFSDFSYKQSPTKMEYRLTPVQEEWKTVYMPVLEFGDLEAGKYTLEVRPISINDEEVPVTTLNIVVKKHWAKTYLALVGYVLVIVFFMALYRYYYKAKEARRTFYRKKEEMLKNSLAETIKSQKEESIVNQLRNQARYGMARELRTPLSLVTAPLKEMMADNSLPSTLQPKTKLAYRNAISMQDVCDLMLDIYEQESEKMQLSVGEYPASTIVNNAISSSNELLNIAPIKLHYDKDKPVKTPIWVDRKKMEYIFRNILSNAYRHISYSGNVYVRTFTKNIDGIEYFCVQIEDEGKDIIQESAVYILSKEEGGNELTGQLCPELGILLMKEQIIAHHGDIHIEQKKDAGTCTTVFIPLGKEHFENDNKVTFVEAEPAVAEQPEAPAIITAEEKQSTEEETMSFSIATPPSGTKHKILVIEDHKDIRLYLKVLFSANYTVILAENGEEGVRMARKEMPDIILSDVMMPVMNGFECTRILKEDVKTCHIPIILLTALVGDMDVVKGIEYGADDYIAKPFNPDVLRSKVKRLIKSRMDLKQVYMKLMMATNTAEPDKTEEEKPKEDPFIRQIFDIVENNLQNPTFNVKRLAEMLNMSQPTLYRHVKMLTNYTIIELIRGVRLKRAAELLRTRKYSIQEVSEMVGYNDAPTFRKHFVEFYGTTPSTFANKEEAEEKK